MCIRDRYYPAGVRERQLAERVLEGESYFPKLEKWLYFTAAPIRDRQGRIVAAMESSQDTVSYTHLDVYKRQIIVRSGLLQFPAHTVASPL